MRLNKAYISAIYPFSPAVDVWGHTAASLGVFSPSKSSLNIGFHPATGASCASCASVCERSYTHQIKRTLRGEQRDCFRPRNRRGSRRNRLRTRASYPRLCRRPARAPSVLPSRNGRFCPRLRGLRFSMNVYFYVSLLLLRFLGSSCSVCLPSLPTGHARNLRLRNFKSRRGAASVSWRAADNGAGAPPYGAHSSVTGRAKDRRLEAIMSHLNTISNVS